MTNTIEGNLEYYKYNFANSLNKEVKTDREERNLFGGIIKKLNRFLKSYIGYQDIPDQQPCLGRFDKWSTINQRVNLKISFEMFCKANLTSI
jgi:hypothetical protein